VLYSNRTATLVTLEPVRAAFTGACTVHHRDAALTRLSRDDTAKTACFAIFLAAGAWIGSCNCAS
jgi:hypothetical protein